MVGLKHTLAAAGAAALLACIGCGGGSSIKLAPTPSGSYTNASLSGSYAFALTGQNSYGTLSIAGSLTLDGNGNITGGAQDVNSGSGVFTNLGVTGTYTIGADGRGTAVLNSSAGAIDLDFVVVSPQRALLTRFDGNSTASGSMDLQNASAFSAAALKGGYAFGLSGVDGSRNPLQAAGMFTADGAGGIASGVEDLNDNGSATTNLALSGSYTVGTANGRGTATFTTAQGTNTFAFYIVDGTHVKMVETDTAPALAGDAYSQPATLSNATLNGAYAFTAAGGTTGPIVEGGVFTADGNGTITGGTEDLNNNYNISQNLLLTGTYSIAGNGRGTLTLTNSVGTFQYVVYPSSGGVAMLETDALVAEGTAYAQTTATGQGRYGMNFSGVNGSGELDAIAQFTVASGGSLSGALDLNNAGNLLQDMALSGNYANGSNGRGTISLKSSYGTITGAVYTVSASHALFIELDQGQAAVGELEQQQ